MFGIKTKNIISKKGFTLIELLVVVAVIILITTIVLVSITDAQKKSRISSIRQQMKSLSSAGNLCRAAIPLAGTIQAGIAGDDLCSNVEVTDVTFPYIKTCGSNPEDMGYSAIDGNRDYWQIELSTCSGFTDCEGLTIDSAGFVVNPEGCM